jgi:hypothetical protein
MHKRPSRVPSTRVLFVMWHAIRRGKFLLRWMYTSRHLVGQLEQKYAQSSGAATATARMCELTARIRVHSCSGMIRFQSLLGKSSLENHPFEAQLFSCTSLKISMRTSAGMRYNGDTAFLFVLSGISSRSILAMSKARTARKRES